MSDEFQVVIIGAGPAGLTAAIYCARARAKTLLIEKGLPGGLITITEAVENYPGFPDAIGGMELTERMRDQAKRFGIEPSYGEVSSVEIKNNCFVIKTTDAEYATRAVIVASGSTMVKLGVPGEDEFTGRGVSWCATCDGFFYDERKVAVVGGGDAALSEALYLTKFASTVYLIHRRNEFRATKILQEQVLSEPKIKPLLSQVITEIKGADIIQSLALRNTSTDESSDLDVDGVFIAIGYRPNTRFLEGVVELGDNGVVLVNKKMETNVHGIYAAGDVRQDSIRQVISAAGDGATAAVQASHYLSELQ